MARTFPVEDHDQAWLPCIVEGVFALAPDADAWCTKEHLLDEHVLLRGEPALLRRASANLLKRLSEVPTLEFTDTSTQERASGRVCLRQVSPNFANMVRKGLMTRIHVWAASEIEVLSNTSTYLDEQIAHRVGQLAFVVPEEYGAEVELVGRVESVPKQRVVRGSDIVFVERPGVAIAKPFAQSIILHLDGCEEFSARVHLTRAMALNNHDMYSAIPSPSYRPVLQVRECCVPRVSQALASRGYTLSTGGPRQGWVVQHDAVEVRREAVEEAFRAAGVHSDDVFAKSVDYNIEFECHGQHSSAQCVRLAVAQLSREIGALSNAATEDA